MVQLCVYKWYKKVENEPDIHGFTTAVIIEGIMELKSNDHDRKVEILKFLDSFETKVEDTIKLYDAWGNVYEQAS